MIYVCLFLAQCGQALRTTLGYYVKEGVWVFRDRVIPRKEPQDKRSMYAERQNPYL